MRARSTNSWYEIEIASGSPGKLGVLTNFWWRPELCCFPCCCCNRKSVLWWPQDDNSWEGDTSRLNPGSPLLGHPPPQPPPSHTFTSLAGHKASHLIVHRSHQVSNLIPHISDRGGWPMSSHDLYKWLSNIHNWKTWMELYEVYVTWNQPHMAEMTQPYLSCLQLSQARLTCKLKLFVLSTMHVQGIFVRPRDFARAHLSGEGTHIARGGDAFVVFTLFS